MTAAIEFPDGFAAAAANANPDDVARWAKAPNVHIQHGVTLPEFRCKMTTISVDLEQPFPGLDPDEFKDVTLYVHCPEHGHYFLMVETPVEVEAFYMALQMDAIPSPAVAAALIVAAERQSNLPVPLIIPVKNQNILN